jgi:hypothetical protein
MSLSVPNTGATAVEANRYAVITQDRLVTSWNWRQRGGNNRLVERRQEHGQHQAEQDGMDFAWAQRRPRRDRRGVAEFDDLGGDASEIPRRRLRQRFFLSRGTALAVEMVHGEFKESRFGGARGVSGRLPM